MDVVFVGVLMFVNISLNDEYEVMFACSILCKCLEIIALRAKF